MPLKKRFFVISFLLILIISFSGRAFSQTAPDSARAARALALQELLGSIEGIAKEPPLIFKTADGYLRFVGAPLSTNFPVDPNRRATPQEAADAFLEEYRNLFVNESPAVGFQTFRVKTRDSRTYVRYQQMYGDLKVFGAEMVVQVNAAGGIDAVMSDIMRDTEALDTGKVSLNPTIDALTAQGKAIEFLAAEHRALEFKASDATLMIFEPSVVGSKGETLLVWETKVGAVDGTPVRELVLVDAHSGNIAFNYSLVFAAGNPNRRVYDYSEVGTVPWPPESPSGEPDRGEGGDEMEIDDIDDAYDYLGDAYDFYWSHHDERDSYDGEGADLIAAVLFVKEDGTAWWVDDEWVEESYMLICEGMVADDVVGHEFTHGVTFSESNLIYDGESGAITESFSDMWGEWIDQTNGRGTDTTAVKWLCGEDIDWEYLHETWPSYVPSGMVAVRDMEDPTRDIEDGIWRGGQPDRMSDYDEEGGVHTNNGIGNKLAYLLSRDGDDTFNGYTISGMGIPDVADLFYECQTNLLTSGSDYHDLGILLMLAAMNLSEELGLTYGDRYNIEKACRAVEIYDAPSKFYIKNSSGVPVAYFDNLGNLVLKGTLTEEGGQTRPTATGDDEFIFKDSSGNLMIINTTNGNMYIYGAQQQQWQAPSGENDFIIEDSEGAVAYIDESGNLYLTGKLYEQNP